jgi:lipopolysaccharide export system permease protein
VILFLYGARRALGAFLVALAGVVGVFLAIDFVDNAPGYGGHGWLPAVLELYANKAAVVAYQLAPAALLLGAAIAASTFRQTREWTAMRAAGLGPWRVAVPIFAVALAVGGTLVVLNDVVGVRAALRAEELQAVRFGRGGDMARYMAWRQPKRWFRGADGRRIYDLRGTLPEGGFQHVTVLEVTPAFQLARRIDAGRMTPAGTGGDWMLEDVEERTFLPDGGIRLERWPSHVYAFPEPPGTFSVAPGRPSQLRWQTLVHQIGLRKRLGLPAAAFELERYNRLAYPLAGVPGVLLAVALALRSNRKGHISAALLEAVGISLLFWGAQGITMALGLSGRVVPWMAAWLPNVAFLALGVTAVQRTK